MCTGTGGLSSAMLATGRLIFGFMSFFCLASSSMGQSVQTTVEVELVGENRDDDGGLSAFVIATPKLSSPTKDSEDKIIVRVDVPGRAQLSLRGGLWTVVAMAQ